jgi:hypothetical protein
MKAVLLYAYGDPTQLRYEDTDIRNMHSLRKTLNVETRPDHFPREVSP